MARLEYYNDFQSKKNRFNVFDPINTKEEFDIFYNRINTLNQEMRGSLFFRGVNEAKYKLYNSAQRVWITKELSKWHPPLTYLEMVKQTIEEAREWCNGLLKKFYRAFGRRASDIPVLSFLQHYGAPTPLLDWTYSLDNALFFALDGLKHYESDTIIDNYFSIYIISRENNDELLNIRDIYNNEINRLNFFIEGENNQEILRSIDEHKKTLYKYFTAIGFISNFKLFYISDFEIRNGVISVISGNASDTDLRTLYSNTNFNIINQQGLFIFNSDPTSPIDDLFTGALTEGNPYNIRKINCAHIHKNLYEYINAKLVANKITRSFIYPQEEQLAFDSFKSFLNK